MLIHLAMVRKRRGNPNWGKPLPFPPAVATEFEGVALRLGLTKETYSSSSQLRIWCLRNSNRCYVPEWLLKEWGIIPDVGWSRYLPSDPRVPSTHQMAAQLVLSPIS